MDKEKLDSLIQDTLYEKAETVNASPELKHDIMRRISNREEENHRMKKHFNRRVIILAAALSVVGAMVVIAAGKMGGLVSHTNINDPAYSSYEAMADGVKNDLGFEVKAVDTFFNSYSFQKAYVGDVNAVDEAGNTIGSYKNLRIQYGKSGDAPVMMSVSRPGDLGGADERAPHAQTVNDGITVNYYHDTYKFLPPGTEISEEDRQAEARGELFLSYGSDKVEVKYYDTVVWEDEGTRYEIMSGDRSFSSEELFAMAADVIGGNTEKQ